MRIISKPDGIESAQIIGGKLIVVYEHETTAISMSEVQKKDLGWANGEKIYEMNVSDKTIKVAIKSQAELNAINGKGTVMQTVARALVRACGGCGR